MIACLSPNGLNDYAAASPIERLFVATVDGVAELQQTDNEEWVLANRSLTGLHIGALVYDTSTGLLFAGVHGEGLYRSSDMGNTWQIAGSAVADLHIYSLTRVATDRSVVLYAGTEPAGLLHTDDNGETWVHDHSLLSVDGAHQWTFPAPPHIAHVKTIACHPTDSAHLYVGIEQGGLFISSDAGDTWQESTGYLKPRDVPYKDIHRVVSCRDGDGVYMTAGTGFYHSPDRGVTWRQLTTTSFRIGYPDALSLSPDGTSIFIAGAAKSPHSWFESQFAKAAIVRSDDGGKTWDPAAITLASESKPNIEALALHDSGTGFSLFVGTTEGEVHWSQNEGRSFSRISGDLSPISKLTHNAILDGSFARG